MKSTYCEYILEKILSTFEVVPILALIAPSPLIQSSLDCRANVEQFNHQCFERSAKICEPLDIEAKKPRICGRQIMRDNIEAESGRLL